MTPATASRAANISIASQKTRHPSRSTNRRVQLHEDLHRTRLIQNSHYHQPTSHTRPNQQVPFFDRYGSGHLRPPAFSLSILTPSARKHTPLRRQRLKDKDLRPAKKKGKPRPPQGLHVEFHDCRRHVPHPRRRFLTSLQPASRHEARSSTRRPHRADLSR